MTVVQQFFLAVYAQIKHIALIVLPILIRRGWSVQSRLTMLGLIGVAALCYVAVVFFAFPAVD
jgi:hypothetical protein